MTEAASAPALFELPPDIADARAWAHDFAERYVRPVAAEQDDRETMPLGGHRGSRPRGPLHR